MSKTLTDQELIDQCDTGVKHRRKVELAIVHRLIQDLTAAGHELIYSDGEGDFKNQTEQEGINTVFSCDEGYIYPARGDKKLGFVFLVMGNSGTDIISDYSMNLDEKIVQIFEWVDEQEANGTF